MGKKSAKMYDKDKAPKLDRDDKGNVTVKEGKGVSEKQKDADETQAGTEDVTAKEKKSAKTDKE